jgi:outer membrane scaffolding protein for murein synthesis (MipA/OmpV family)
MPPSPIAIKWKPSCGVNAAQAARTSYRVYGRKAGIVNSSLSLGLNYEAFQNWSFGDSIGTERLSDRAAQSPIFEKRYQPSASQFATYSL